MKTVRLKKYKWRNWKMGYKKSAIDKQVDGDLAELNAEKSKDIEYIKKRKQWLP